MKRLKQILCLALSVALCGSMAACKRHGKIIDPTIEDTKNLYITILNRGYGTDWLFDIAEAFEAKTGINTVVTKTDNTAKPGNDMKKGPNSDMDTDLFFDLNGTQAVKANYTNMWKDYPEGLLDMTPLFDMEIEGEGVTYGEKMVDSVKKYENLGTEENPAYYAVPWACGFMGMTYNVDVFTELYGANYANKLPKTTDELYALALDIKQKGGYAFAFPGQIEYFSNAMFSVWWAQYEGTDNYENFYRAQVYDKGLDAYIQSKDIFKQQGRLEALKVMAELLDNDTGLYYKAGYSYGQDNFRDLQEMYLIKSNKIAMFPNGDWLETESGHEDACTIGMMKSPVISSIINVVPDRSIADDATLAAVVDYVDAGMPSNKPSAIAGVTDRDIARVREARYFVSAMALSHLAYAPAYTNAKTNVYKFLNFMASNEALKIYKQNVKGGFLPFKYDYADVTLTKFEQDIVGFLRDFNYCGDDLRLSPPFYRGGVAGNRYADATYIETKLAAPKSSSMYRTAQQAFEEFFYTDAEWELVPKN